MPQKTGWDTIGKVKVSLEPRGTPMASTWWVTEANKLMGLPCPKCGNACTSGNYVAANSLGDNRVHGECAVVNNCLLCGTETVYKRGVDRVPKEASDMHMEQNRPTIRLAGKPHHKKVKGEYTYGA